MLFKLVKADLLELNPITSITNQKPVQTLKMPLKIKII